LIFNKKLWKKKDYFPYNYNNFFSFKYVYIFLFKLIKINYLTNKNVFFFIFHVAVLATIFLVYF